MEEALLDSRQVAARLNISRSYVYFLVRVGDLPCIHIRNAIRVRPQDVERYLRRRPRILRIPRRHRKPS